MPERERFAVLTVDDDARIRRTLRGVLEDEGHETGEAANASEAYEALEKRRWDVVLLDLTMPGEHGLDALLRIREQSPDTAVIVVSGESTLENAVKAGQRGAFDFVPKPINDPEHLLEVLREAVKVTRLRRGTAERGNGERRPSRTGGAAGADMDIVGDGPAVERMREQIRRVAPSNGRVLITGENGAGKELAALAIHALSKRANAPFVKLNCAAIPKDLFESELFGYEKGAFTGATATKKGRLELADGGTLFRDDRRPGAGCAGEVAARARDRRDRALGRHAHGEGGRAAVAATNKDPPPRSSGEFRVTLLRLNGLPVVPRCASGRGRPAARYSRCFAEAEGGAPMTLRTTRASCSRSTTGPATCARCAISWSAPSCW
jgi:two-component system nitrogen regulation response regulator NtrX